MTQPDGLFPESMFNFDSIAELAAKTQEEWLAELEGNTTGGLEEFLDGLFAGLPSGMKFGLALITALVRRLLGDPTASFPTVSEALAALKKVPALQDLVEIITGVEDGDLNDLGTWVSNLLRGDYTDVEKLLRGALDGFNLGPGGLRQQVQEMIRSAMEEQVASIRGEITAAVTDVVGDFALLKTTFENYRTTFDMTVEDLLDGDFDFEAAIDRLIENRLKPLKAFAELDINKLIKLVHVPTLPQDRIIELPSRMAELAITIGKVNGLDQAIADLNALFNTLAAAAGSTANNVFTWVGQLFGGALNLIGFGQLTPQAQATINRTAIQGKTVMAVGNSLSDWIPGYDATYNYDSHYDSALVAIGTPGHNGRDWLFGGNVLANSPLEVLGSMATSGYTMAQIRDVLMPTVIAAKPQFAWFFGIPGNDVLVPGFISDATLSVAAQIFTSALNAGITPIIASMPPAVNATTGVTQAEMSYVNTWLASWASKNSCKFVDFYQALVDPATGDYKSGLSADNVHPSEYGAALLAPLVAAMHTSIVNGAPVSRYLPVVNDSVAGQMDNPLLAGSGGLPTGWSIVTSGTKGLTAGTINGVAAGQKLTISGDCELSSPSLTMAPGDEWDLTFRLTSAPVAAGSWGFTIFNQANTPVAQAGLRNAPMPLTMTDKICSLNGRTPAGTTSLRVQFFTHDSGGSGSAMSIEQLAFRKVPIV